MSSCDCEIVVCGVWESQKLLAAASNWPPGWARSGDFVCLFLLERRAHRRLLDRRLRHALPFLETSIRFLSNGHHHIFRGGLRFISTRLPLLKSHTKCEIKITSDSFFPSSFFILAFLRWRDFSRRPIFDALDGDRDVEFAF